MISTLKTHYKSWRSVRSTMSQLNKLSEYSLNDIGLNRGDVPSVALYASRR